MIYLEGKKALTEDRLLYATWMAQPELVCVGRKLLFQKFIEMLSLDSYPWTSVHRELQLKTSTSNVLTFLFMAVYLLLWMGRKGKS